MEHFKKAYKLYIKKAYSESLDLFELLDDSPGTLFNIGRIHSALESEDYALKFYQKYLTLEPYSPLGHFQAGNTHYALDQYTDAVECYDQALECLGDSLVLDCKKLGVVVELFQCEILFNRALCRLSLRDHDGFFTDIDRASAAVQNESQEKAVSRAARKAGKGAKLFLLTRRAIYSCEVTQVRCHTRAGLQRLIHKSNRSSGSGNGGEVDDDDAKQSRRSSKGSSKSRRNSLVFDQLASPVSAKSSGSGSSNSSSRSGGTTAEKEEKSAKRKPSTTKKKDSSGNDLDHQPPTPPLEHDAPKRRNAQVSPERISRREKDEDEEEEEEEYAGKHEHHEPPSPVSEDEEEQHHHQHEQPVAREPLPTGEVIKVKVHHGDETYVLVVTKTIQYDQLARKIQLKLNHRSPAAKLKLQYLDIYDDELINLMDQDDLDLAKSFVDHHPNQNHNVVLFAS